MNKILTTSLLTAGLVGALATPALATPPGGGCAGPFHLAPLSVLGPNPPAQADNVNHDGYICVWRNPAGVGIYVENIAPH